jgi:Fur family transcriptional regulator, peroxide stress response regulator
MHPKQVADRLLEFESLCRARGMPLTVQRRKVLEAVLERDDHPTADQIAEVVRDRVPGISRTTVYRVLETLVEMDLIRRLHHPGAAARFDGKVSRHHHLICKQCHTVIDLEDANLDRLSLPDVGREGFTIDDFSVQFTGLCRACRRKT